jgi:antirestriction protein ArdC
VRHADYISSWIDCMRENNRAIIRAASAASKAADYLLAFRDGDLVAEDPVAPPMFVEPDLSSAAAAQP